MRFVGHVLMLVNRTAVPRAMFVFHMNSLAFQWFVRFVGHACWLAVARSCHGDFAASRCSRCCLWLAFHLVLWLRSWSSAQWGWFCRWLRVSQPGGRGPTKGPATSDATWQAWAAGSSSFR